MRDFYATAAQILPVLILALLWESGYLTAIRSQNRARGVPGGVAFWSFGRVRAFLIGVAGTTIAGIGLSVLVLGGTVDDSVPVRAIVVVSILITLATLLTRVVVDVVRATKPTGGGGAP